MIDTRCFERASLGMLVLVPSMLDEDYSTRRNTGCANTGSL